MQRRLRRQADERVALAAAEAARAVAEENDAALDFLARMPARRSAARSMSRRRARACSRCSCRGSASQATAGALRRRRRELAAPMRLEIGVDGRRLVRRRECRRALDPARPRRCARPSPRPRRPRSRALAGAAAPLRAAARQRGSHDRRRWSPGRRRGDADRGAHASSWPSAPRSRSRTRASTATCRSRSTSAAASRPSCRTSNRRKDEFLAMLSHELRNPLAPIRTALEVIRRIAPAEPKLTWAHDVIGRQVAHLTRLVEDLLDVARINQGKIALQIEPLDLRAVVAHGVETARPLLDARRHQLDRRLPDAPVLLRGDFARLPRSSPTCSTTPPSTPRRAGASSSRWRCRRGPRRVISVRDNGIGIDAELLPQRLRAVRAGQALARPQPGRPRRRPDARAAPGRAARRPRRGEQRRRRARAREFRVAPALPQPRSLDAEAAGRAAGRASAAARGLPRPRRRRQPRRGRGDRGAPRARRPRGQGGRTTAPRRWRAAPVFAPDVVLLDIGLPRHGRLRGRAAAARAAETAGVAADRADRLRPAGRPRRARATPASTTT